MGWCGRVHYTSMYIYESSDGGGGPLKCCIVKINFSRKKIYIYILFISSKFVLKCGLHLYAFIINEHKYFYLSCGKIVSGSYASCTVTKKKY